MKSATSAAVIYGVPRANGSALAVRARGPRQALLQLREERHDLALCRAHLLGGRWLRGCLVPER